MWNNNKVTKSLGITYPIIQAGMAGGTTTPELIAAVSNAGGLGTLGAGYMKAEDMREVINKIKKLTNQPFGVNLFIPEVSQISKDKIKKANELLRPYREELHVAEPEVKEVSTANFDQQVEVIIQEEIAVCSFTFGVPSKDIVQQLQKENIIVMGTATTVREAIINEECGVDMVVMQGSEAGGHRGTFSGSFSDSMIGTMSLVPQAADHVHIPVIAAGGIMDGRGVLAALTLGAQAVQMGTAFVTAVESGATTQHIDAILKSTEDQTVITSVFSGKPARGIQNDFIHEVKPYEEELPDYPIMNALTTEIRSEAAKQNRPEWIHLWSGQSPRLSTRQHAAALLSDIVLQVENIMSNR
ncbi:nitronate monooxygenase [Sporosarcina sp. P12(2017)]|uniref:NAD(P)H-dependent flavin oxidoreductase n=1 Tax=unclassified Sporosarcina TaxID=2647733 RepID=UPI000C16C36F|nr:MULTISPECIES: nitronate monooxygenase [unclassified Sporosarcina]PIC56368.1 nitronate monooxygenase [Sporosarcina sp. P10]PIC59665.1 nitronate monooxygenase [Sporosarcina sp. P12(2017)]